VAALLSPLPGRALRREERRCPRVSGAGEAPARFSGAGPDPEPGRGVTTGAEVSGAEVTGGGLGAAPAEDGDPLHQDMEAVQPSG